MLDKIPSPLSGATCNEKTGWLPPNFDDNCREILSETIENVLTKMAEEVGENESARASTSNAKKNNDNAEVSAVEL